MNDENFRRVTNLVKQRLKKDDCRVILVGLNESKLGEAILELCSKHGIEFVSDTQTVIGLSLFRDDLVLVTSLSDVRSLKKLRIKPKVELVDAGRLPAIVGEALKGVISANGNAGYATSSGSEPVDTTKEDRTLSDSAKNDPATEVNQSDEDGYSEVAVELTPFQTFVQRFMEEADKAGEEGVGSFVVNKLVRDCKLDGNAKKLATDGWLQPVVRKGRRRVGGYLPTSKMLEENSTTQNLTLSDNPYERARQLIASEPRLEAERDKLESQIEEIDQQLERIAKARRWLDEAQGF